eukprot:6461887-Ditylum_brightwellii.AAC.1
MGSLWDRGQEMRWLASGKPSVLAGGCWPKLISDGRAWPNGISGGRYLWGGMRCWFCEWNLAGFQNGSTMRSLFKSNIISDVAQNFVGAGKKPKVKQRRVIASLSMMTMHAAAIQPHMWIWQYAFSILHLWRKISKTGIKGRGGGSGGRLVGVSRHIGKCQAILWEGEIMGDPDLGNGVSLSVNGGCEAKPMRKPYLSSTSLTDMEMSLSLLGLVNTMDNICSEVLPSRVVAKECIKVFDGMELGSVAGGCVW